MDMSKLLTNWTPSPEQEYMVLDAPGDKPISLALRVIPGPTSPDKQILLMQMVDADRWGRGAPRDWLLWEIKVSLSGIAVVELDGRGPKRRTVEPLKSRQRWGRHQPNPALDEPFNVAISYNPVAGGLSIVRGDDVMTGNTFLKASGDVKLIVGRPPQYTDLASPEGWTFDLSWSLGGAVTTLPPGAPTLPPSTSQDDLAVIDKAIADIETILLRVRSALSRLVVRS